MGHERQIHQRHAETASKNPLLVFATPLFSSIISERIRQSGFGSLHDVIVPWITLYFPAQLQHLAARHRKWIRRSENHAARAAFALYPQRPYHVEKSPVSASTLMVP